MTKLIPNLHELISLLEPGSDAALVSSAFDTDTSEAAGIALRQLVYGWDSIEAQGDQAK